jgi:hypothetical protein
LQLLTQIRRDPVRGPLERAAQVGDLRPHALDLVAQHFELAEERKLGKWFGFGHGKRASPARACDSTAVDANDEGRVAAALERMVRINSSCCAYGIP